MYYIDRGKNIPNIKDDSTVEAIAREFTSNGRNKTQAMITVGYDPVYADGGRGQNSVYGNTRTKEAISRIDAELGAEAGRTVAGVDKLYQQAYDLAKQSNQPSAMVSASTGIARLYGMDKDASTDKQDTPTTLTPEQADIARAAAKRMTEISLSKDTG